MGTRLRHTGSVCVHFCRCLLLLQLANSVAEAAHPGAPIFAHPNDGALDALDAAAKQKIAAANAAENAGAAGTLPFHGNHNHLPLPRGPNDEVVIKSFAHKHSPASHRSSFFNSTSKQIGEHAKFIFGKIRAIPGSWICTALASLLVVLCGIIPAFLIPSDGGKRFHDGFGSLKLNRLLSFAVGSLLGDVFLHILPEAWQTDQRGSAFVGLWTIAGLLVCYVVEKFGSQTEESQHKVAAVMNLVANLVDNFTHGLAVGGSFLVNFRFGCLTTFAILIHEIPHEISDFAILLRADFNRVNAIKAQLLTAVGGVAGAVVALATSSGSLCQSSLWILPFTAGGFLNIALVQILPDLMAETDRRECFIQIGLILLGIVSMGAVSSLPI